MFFMIEENDVVKLLKPTLVEWEGVQLELKAGQTGTVVAISKTHNQDSDPISYLVDFSDDNGEIIAMVSVQGADLELVWKSTVEQ
jgi:hypothetical protein